MSETADDDIASLPFEAALAELERLVQNLERGDVPLDQSIRLYERGEALKRHCEQLLAAVEARVQKITTDSDGQPTGTVPLDRE